MEELKQTVQSDQIEQAKTGWFEKHKKSIFKYSKIIALLLVGWLIGATGLIGLPGFTLIYNTDETFTNELIKLNYLEKLIKKNYIEEVDSTALGTAALKGMMESLDAYSEYYTSEEYEAYLNQTLGNFYGIGVYLDMSDPEGQGILITGVIEDGPAEKGGIQAGDVIVAVDGTDVTNSDYSELLSYVMGEKGSEVTVTVKRGDEQLDFTLVRDAISVTSVYTAMFGDIGYLELSSFDEDSANQFKSGVENLIEEGATALIIDLRYNTGGLLDTAVEITDYLLPETSIGKMVTRTGQSQSFTSDAESISIPYVVLVNNYSASASEFTSGNIQQAGGIIIGTTTYGKGVAQSFGTIVSDNSGYKLTTEEYFVGENTKVNGLGITPNIVVETQEDILTSETADENTDLQLKAAIDYLSQQTTNQ